MKEIKRKETGIGNEMASVFNAIILHSSNDAVDAPNGNLKGDDEREKEDDEKEEDDKKMNWTLVTQLRWAHIKSAVADEQQNVQKEEGKDSLHSKADGVDEGVDVDNRKSNRR